MKKYLIILVGVFLFPMIVNAAITENTQVIAGEYASDSTIATRCYEDESANGDLNAATSGLFLECVAIKCEDSKNVHYIKHPFKDEVTCANGNKDPYKDITDSGITPKSGGAGLLLSTGASCLESAPKDSSTGAYAFATRIYKYDCSKTSDNKEYKATATNTGTDTNPGSSAGDTSKTNPDTGIEDYYSVLIPTILIVSIGLYVLNKKNIFKKI